jgi:hypothetical protein
MNDFGLIRRAWLSLHAMSHRRTRCAFIQRDAWWLAVAAICVEMNSKKVSLRKL